MATIHLTGLIRNFLRLGICLKFTLLYFTILLYYEIPCRENFAFLFQQKAERAAARAKPLTGPGRTGTRAAIQGTGVTSTGKTSKQTGRGRGTKK